MILGNEILIEKKAGILINVAQTLAIVDSLTELNGKLKDRLHDVALDILKDISEQLLLNNEYTLDAQRVPPVVIIGKGCRVTTKDNLCMKCDQLSPSKVKGQAKTFRDRLSNGVLSK